MATTITHTTTLLPAYQPRYNLRIQPSRPLTKPTIIIPTETSCSCGTTKRVGSRSVPASPVPKSPYGRRPPAPLQLARPLRSPRSQTTLPPVPTTPKRTKRLSALARLRKRLSGNQSSRDNPPVADKKTTSSSITLDSLLARRLRKRADKEEVEIPSDAVTVEHWTDETW